MIRAAREEPFVEPICHVGHRELVSDPIATSPVCTGISAWS